MPFHGLEKIGRAGRVKPAASGRSAKPREERRECQLVDANEETNEQSHRQGGRIEARYARRKLHLLVVPAPWMRESPPIRRNMLPHVQALALDCPIRKGMDRAIVRPAAPAAATLFPAHQNPPSPPRAGRSPPARHHRPAPTDSAARPRASGAEPDCARPRRRSAARSQTQPERPLLLLTATLPTSAIHRGPSGRPAGPAQTPHFASTAGPRRSESDWDWSCHRASRPSLAHPGSAASTETGSRFTIHKSRFPHPSPDLHERPLEIV